jgi:1-aminocyclopropane-1-carboxylate deaminase/D-cysteine desulfhydrase-like pyridoxal-dependent ACC family enzyme
VYSGKAMAGLIALARGGGASGDPGLSDAKAIVFLASGGVPALFASRYEGWLTSGG